MPASCRIHYYNLIISNNIQATIRLMSDKIAKRALKFFYKEEGGGGHLIQKLKGPNFLSIFHSFPLAGNSLQLTFHNKIFTTTFQSLLNKLIFDQLLSLISNQHRAILARLNTVLLQWLVVLDVTLTRSIPQLPLPLLGARSNPQHNPKAFCGATHPATLLQ